MGGPWEVRGGSFLDGENCKTRQLIELWLISCNCPEVLSWIIKRYLSLLLLLLSLLSSASFISCIPYSHCLIH